MKLFYSILLISLLNCFCSFAQEVEHNYKVGPQSTNCDSLDISGQSASQSIELIRATKFRFNQSFRLSRKQGLQLGAYYSCDNKGGFLIIKYDGKENLYHKVDKHLWEEFISSSDPEGYYLKVKQQLQSHH